MNTTLKSIMGGFLIGLGGTCFLAIDNKILGSFMFSLGLLSICVTGQFLYTGKVSYIRNPITLISILIWNYVGATGLGYVVGYIRPDLKDKAIMICSNKLNEGSKVVILGILCNILIYFAVEGFNQGYYILLILCVMAFILCGFEHCIANMFYFGVAWMFELKYILLNIIGNTIGGIIIQVFNKFSK